MVRCAARSARTGRASRISAGSVSAASPTTASQAAMRPSTVPRSSGGGTRTPSIAGSTASSSSAASSMFPRKPGRASAPVGPMPYSRQENGDRFRVPTKVCSCGRHDRGPRCSAMSRAPRRGGCATPAPPAGSRARPDAASGRGLVRTPESRRCFPHTRSAAAPAPAGRAEPSPPLSGTTSGTPPAGRGRPTPTTSRTGSPSCGCASPRAGLTGTSDLLLLGQQGKGAAFPQEGRLTTRAGQLSGRGGLLHAGRCHCKR